jgi:hypothetical protein
MSSAVHSILLALCALSGVWSLPSPAVQEKPEKRFTAGIDICPDREKCAKFDVRVDDVHSAVARFFKKNRTFKLSELQNLSVTSNHGVAVQIRQVATIEVDFELPRSSGKGK